LTILASLSYITLSMVLPYIYVCQNELKRMIDAEENEPIKEACMKG